MAPPPYRRRPLDHVIEILGYLEKAEEALARIDLEKVPTRAGERAIVRLTKAVAAGKAGCADGIEALTDGALVRQPAKRPAATR